MLKNLATNIIEKNLEKLDTQKMNLEDLATQTNILREKLVKEIRIELSEI